MNSATVVTVNASPPSNSISIIVISTLDLSISLILLHPIVVMPFRLLRRSLLFPPNLLLHSPEKRFRTIDIPTKPKLLQKRSKLSGTNSMRKRIESLRHQFQIPSEKQLPAEIEDFERRHRRLNHLHPSYRANRVSIVRRCQAFPILGSRHFGPKCHLDLWKVHVDLESQCRW